jgi:hypothetical protein
MQKLVVFKVREGKLNLWRSWSAELMGGLREEALDTLKEENAVAEFGALAEIGGAHYVIGYMEGEDMVPANMDREINRKHKAMREECLEYVSNGEFLYHLRRDI